MLLLKRPVALAVAVLAFWLLLRWGGVAADQPTLLKADEAVLVSGFFTPMTVLIALLAAAVFTKVWSEWMEVRNAVKGEKKDEEAFMKYVDERIPPTVKAALLILFGALLGAFFLLHIQSLVVGSYIIFALTFALAFYWEVIMDLDDYWTGVWNIRLDDVPEAWAWSKTRKEEIRRITRS
jgi:hypothetical protein